MLLSRSEKLLSAVDFSLCNTVKMLSVRDCGILNSNGTPWPTAQGSGNIVEEKQTEWKSQRMEWSAVNAVIWTWCGCCAHELRAAMLTYTRSSQSIIPA